MATTRENITLSDGSMVTKQVTDKGIMYTKSVVSLGEELDRVGSNDFERPNKKALFIAGNAYYVGPSLQDKSDNELADLCNKIKVQTSCLGSEFEEAKKEGRAINWVKCLFLSSVETKTFKR